MREAVTLELDDEIIREAERLAAKRGISLDDLVEQLLRECVQATMG